LNSQEAKGLEKNLEGLIGKRIGILRTDISHKQFLISVCKPEREFYG
jgi:hypothetical protein